MMEVYLWLSKRSAGSITSKRNHPTLPIGVPVPIPSALVLWKISGGNSIGGNTVLNQDFKEFIRSLNDSEVRYLVVGGYAVAFHGYPRYTKDLDVWIEMSTENAKRVLSALHRFGFSDLELDSTDFLEPDSIIQLGYPPVRIDMITTLDGVTFEECHVSRVEAMIDDVLVPFIDLQHLKQNKKATGRHQDLADLENLD